MYEHFRVFCCIKLLKFAADMKLFRVSYSEELQLWRTRERTLQNWLTSKIVKVSVEKLSDACGKKNPKP